MRVVIRIPKSRWLRWATAERAGAFASLALFLLATWVTARLYSGFANQVVRYALAFITVQVAVLLLLATGLMVSKTISIRLEKVRAVRRQKLEKLLTEALLFHRDQPALLAACAKYPNEAEAAFGMALRRLRGEVREEAERLFIESGLYDRLVKDILSKNPNRALYAVTLVREIDRPEAREAVRAALLHSFSIVRLAARVAVLKNGDDQTKREVLQHVGALPFWQRLALFHYVPNDSDLIQGYLENALASGDDETVLGALEFLLTRQKGFPLPLELPWKLCRSENLEVRIKLFKALPFLCDSHNALPLLKAGLADPDWRVRAMAAKACGTLRVEETGELLLKIAAESASVVEVAHAARAALALNDETVLRIEQIAVQAGSEKAAVLTEILTEVRTGVAA
jgi:hypothetical protein